MVTNEPASSCWRCQFREIHRAGCHQDANTKTRDNSTNMEHAEGMVSAESRKAEDFVNTHARAAAPPWKAPPMMASNAPSWILRLRPIAVADHMMNRLPTAPPAL